MMPISARSLVICSMLVVTTTGSGGSDCVAADVLLLKSGGRLKGTIQRHPNVDDESYIFRIGKGTLVKIPAADVGRVQKLSDDEQRYATLLPDMPDTAKGHFTMAEWCQRNGLRSQRQFHLEQVLKYDPAHVEAHRMLGFKFVRGKWVRSDEFMEAQGYQQYRGNWRLPQQVELEKQQHETELAQKKWRSDIRRWRTWLNGRQRVVGEQKLRAIKDPLAAAGIVDLLPKESDPAVRKIYVDVLARLQNADAMTGLIDRAIYDDELEVRLSAVEGLRGRGAIEPFVRALRSTDNLTVRRAGVVLGRLGDETAVRSLIDALVTTHTYVVKPNSNIQTGFGATSDGSTGINGFSAGGGPKRISQDIENKSVLDALVSITGQNYRYSKPDWKRWYIQKKALPDTVNLRRD